MFGNFWLMINFSETIKNQAKHFEKKKQTVERSEKKKHFLLNDYIKKCL